MYFAYTWILVLIIASLFNSPVCGLGEQLLPQKLKTATIRSPSLSLVGSNARFTEHFLKRAQHKKTARSVRAPVKVDNSGKLHRFYNRFTYG